MKCTRTMQRQPLTRSCRPYSLYKSQTNLKVARDLWLDAVADFSECPAVDRDDLCADDLALATFILTPICHMPARCGSELSAAVQARVIVQGLERLCIQPKPNEALLHHLGTLATQVSNLCLHMTYREGFLQQFQQAAAQAARIRTIFESRASCAVASI